ncbi:tetratricopeptide repeat protein [Flagellimonas zhangzhouensis]|uniref:Tetratricopeptide repeat-containing protein n=1 Tax=Flagellimonas zhangzhouensis TaxID=1073328 RepID=A0A1H2Y1A5_9FLAO|nr:tetratricopeptide repeat protein [Allomuricauda zhangzhouensis]SDQ94121.1 Tetratricopeptide repeat-containing protein [Allomuricauda zhangzhouensis]SDW98755.1 Tetratricopeptide repeat-containing protein [Allomuricauda zhangzhouensis]
MKTQSQILVILFCFIASFVNAQNDKKLDSLSNVYRSLNNDTTKVRILGDLYNATLYNDVEKAKTFALERISLSKKLNFEDGLAAGYYDLGGYYKNTFTNDSARFYFNKALEIYKKHDNVKKIVSINYSNAILEMEVGNYDKALDITNSNIEIRKALKDTLGLAIEYVFRSGINENKGRFKLAYEDVLSALKLYDQLDEPIRKADAFNSLGSLEAISKNHENSIAYGKQALEIYKEHNDKLFEALTSNAIGQSYITLEKSEEAKPYLINSIALSKEMKALVLEGAATRNLGRVYMAEGNTSEGLSLLEKAIEIHRASERPIALIRSLAYASDAYNNIERPNDAMAHLNEAIGMIASENQTSQWHNLYEGRSKSWEILGNYKNALEDHKTFQVLKDSVFNKEKVQQIEELKTIYETEKKEQQIALQEKEITVLEQDAKISNLQKLLLAGLLLLSLIGFYGIRQKLKRNNLEKEMVDAELAFKKKELTTHALHLAKKNEVLEDLKQKAEHLKESETSKGGYQQLIRTINFDLQDDNNWKNFSRYFEEVHKDFNSNVKERFPDVTSNELRLLALLKMNLSSKEIANILNISQEGIKKARYRLRKKLNISSEESLQDIVVSL